MKLSSEWGHHYQFPEPLNLDSESLVWQIAKLSLALDMSHIGKSMPLADLRATRSMLANILIKTTNFGEFDNYCQDHNWTRPTEKDRQDTASWLKWYTSATGLLHANEIDWLTKFPRFNLPASYNNVDFDEPISTHEDLISQVDLWIKTGYVIGAFPGSFDAPTTTHLANATKAYEWAALKGIKMKLIWWFDNDELIKRKGENRPSFDLEKRRRSVNNFWQVSGTAISSAKRVGETDIYANDLKMLTTKYVFATTDELIPAGRIKTADLANAELILLPPAPLNFHSSQKIWKIT